MPKVSVIIPCYNERRTIPDVLDAIRAQTHPLSDMEVIIADGMSTDGTRELIAQYARQHPEIGLRMVDNPERNIPAALNRAVEHSVGQIVLRMDAHAVPYPDYVQRCLETLERTAAANAGGVWEIRAGGEGWLARSIAAAASHMLGAGDARYRTRGQAGPTDTVPFGAFRREWLDRVGPFDEQLLSNEDYELNVRLRRAGGLIWLDPGIRSIYLARSDLPALSRQYYRYGFWKARMLVHNVETVRWRQALPPLFVASVGALALLGLLWKPGWILLGVELGVYGAVSILVAAAEAIHRQDVGLAVGFPLAIWTMHFSWGTGFLSGLLTWAAGGRRYRRGS